MSTLIKKFREEIRPSLTKTMGLSNVNAVPVILKVVVSVGIGQIMNDDKKIEAVASDLARITGQKPKINKSRIAVSAFKLRIGQKIGLTTTLRGIKMHDFIHRLVNVALPRVKDFRGLSHNAFDKNGNYSLGISEHTIMPEIRHEDVKENFGFQININTSANNDKDAKKLLEKMGFPFEKINK